MNECGSCTYVEIQTPQGLRVGRKVSIPYKEFKKLDGEYVAGEGYVITMGRTELRGFLNRHEELRPFWHQIWLLEGRKSCLAGAA